MKNTLNHTLQFWLMLFPAVLMISCKQPAKEDELAKNLSLLDEQAGTYTPQKPGIDIQSSHIAVKIIYDNGKWLLDSSFSELRPGKLPYLLKGSGSFEVIYRDASGKEIGRYRYEDPTLRRVCEGEKPGFSKADRAVIEILLPGNQAIDRFELKQEGISVTSFKVPPVRKISGDHENPATTPGKKDSIEEKQ